MNHSTSEQSHHARVLVVDDEESVREVLTTMLTSHGYDVDCVSTGEDAMSRLNDVPPDLVLLDIVLPDKSGIEVCDQIRNTDSLAELPVLLMTGYGDYESRERGLEADADDFLSKPIDPTEFAKRVKNVLELSRYRSLVEERKRSRRLEATLRKSERERRALAREVHDDLGQGLTALRGFLERARNNRADTESIHSLLDQAIELSGYLVETSRRIAATIRPALLDDLGLCATLSWLCRKMGESYPDIAFEHECLIEEAELDDDLKTAIFRISQEAVNNAVRHSGATAVQLRLSPTASTGSVDGGRGFTLEIADNGTGFDPASATGLGLMGMRERAEHSGGTLHVDSRLGRGSTLRVRWPRG